MAICAALGLGAGYVGGLCSAPSAPAASPAPSPAPDTARVDAHNRELAALRARVATLERAPRPTIVTTPAPVKSAVAPRPQTQPAQPTRVSPPPVAPSKPARPDNDGEEVDEWARYGGRDNFSEAEDLVDDIPSFVTVVTRRLDRELELPPELAALLKAAVTTAGAEASKLGVAYLDGQGDLSDLRRRWAAIETRFRNATAALTRDQRVAVDRTIASVLDSYAWVGPLVRGPSND